MWLLNIIRQYKILLKKILGIQAADGDETGIYIVVNSTNNALRITQLGSGNVLLVEDSANPDATPLVVDNVGDISTGGYLKVLNSTTIPAGGTTGKGYMLSNTENFGIFFGSGAPTLSAAKGSLYMRSDGSTINNRLYINTNGNTTWTAITTVL